MPMVRWQQVTPDHVSQLDYPTLGSSRHVGQWIMVDGEPVHVLAARDMSDETRDALAELVRCAARAIANGTLKYGDEDDEN